MPHLLLSRRFFVAALFVIMLGSSFSGFVMAANVPNPPAQDVYINPLQFNSLEGVLTALLGTLQKTIVILSIIFIIIGALLYITSAGNDSRLSTAKAAITAALIGLALGVAAPSFLKEIAGILQWNNVNNATVAGALTLSQLAVRVLDFLLSIVGIIAIVMLVIGGVAYLTAGGDEARAETGKRIVTYSVIGITIALSALVIVNQVVNFFV